MGFFERADTDCEILSLRRKFDGRSHEFKFDIGEGEVLVRFHQLQEMAALDCHRLGDGSRGDTAVLPFEHERKSIGEVDRESGDMI